MSPLILDVYDDAAGNILREIYPRYDTVPSFIKNAHQITREEMVRLPDDVFGVVLLDEGQKMRKFACVDAGNTALHLLYFMKTGSQLPAEAQDVAMRRLIHSCDVYGLHNIRKEAAMIGALGNMQKNAGSNVGNLITAIKEQARGYR